MEVKNLSHAVTKNHSQRSLMTLFNRDDPIDRISDLPCNVIDRILAHLAIKDLVRTSVLSKKWRYMWTKAPKIWFDEDFFLEYEDEDLDDPWPGTSKIITDVFMQHKRPINKFTFCASSLCDYKITNESLNMFNFPVPPDFFKRLLILRLWFVTFEPGALKSLISSCPLLKKLKIQGCNGFEYFDFSTPTLKVLKLDFDEDMKSICLKKAKNLIVLRIVAFEDWVSGLIKSLPKKIQRLTIGSLYCTNKIIPYADIIPLKLVNSSFSSIKYLKFGGLHFNERGELLYIVSVLKSAPSLVELVIQIDDVDTSQVSDHLDELECSSCCPKLETVNISIREISGSSQHAMSLTQFILANSTSLKTLTFNVGLCSVNLHAPILLRISQDLLRMKRASQRVRVKFLYSGYLVH